MPAQQRAYITTAYLTGATGPVAVGKVLCFTNAATDRFVVATTANLSTYGQNPSCIALTAGDNTNVEVEVQQVGFVPNSITGLGAGAAGDVCVSALGVLARGSSPVVVGKCDAEGNAHINFAGIGVGGGASATPGGSVNDIQYKSGASTFGGITPPAAGTVLRSTGPGALPAFGAVDLDDSDAVTGTLGVNNGGTNLATADLAGQANKAVTVNVGETGYTFTTLPAGTSPGGADNEGQYNNGGAFGGMSGLVYDEATNRPQLVNGWYLSSGANRFLFTGTPAGARTITFQDATHTVVGRDTTDTLTNKTVNASSNTLTDTSIAQYDLLLADATPKFVRFAKGASSTVLTTSAGNAVQWGAVVLTTMVSGTLPIANGGTNRNTIAGAANELVTVDGSATGYTAASNVKGGSGFISIGSGTVHATALIRLPYNGGSTSIIIGTRRSSAVDDSLLSHGSGDQYTLGNYGNILTILSSSLQISVASVSAATCDGAKFGLALPVSGSSGDSVPFRFKEASITMTNGGFTTASAAQYECPLLTFTGGDASSSGVELPSSGGGFWNYRHSAHASATLGVRKSGGGTVGAVTVNKGRFVKYSTPAADMVLMEVP